MNYTEKKSAADITANSNFLSVDKIPQKGNQDKSVHSVTVQYSTVYLQISHCIFVTNDLVLLQFETCSIQNITRDTVLLEKLLLA
jgi:hypothetical protein